MDAEFREFFGGPWNGEVRLCRTKFVQIPTLPAGPIGPPGDRGFGQVEYVLDSEGDMVLRHGNKPDD